VISVLLLSVSLAGCLDMSLRGDDAAARDCHVELINQATDPLEIAGGYAGIGNIEAANEWYRKGAEAEADNADLRVAWGRLFASVHQAGDAEALYQEALVLDPQHFGARVAMAELYMDRFDGPTRAIVDELLEERPLAPAPRLMSARMKLEVGDRGTAASELDALLAEADHSVSVRLKALSLRATIALLDGERDNPWMSEIREINPGYGQADATAAHFYIVTRRYMEAVALLEAAVARDETLWQAHSELGLNLLRVNRLEDARRHLELAYQGDPYNAVTVNTLRLLDTLDGFDTVESEHLILRAPPSESAALVPDAHRLAERAVAEMAPRYGYRFERAMVVELFEHHDDFAVRTAGLPGIGILGATFGDVVVMDGPSAKPFSEGFDWASALWHEIAHVVTLNATNNLVSRWFSEGVSVYEEWRFGPSRRRSLPISFLEAWREERLLPVADLDEGFIRPTYEGQIMVSYVQAGLVCMLIADHYPRGLEKMLAVYRAGGDNDAAIRDGLEVDPEALDRLLEAYLAESYAGPAEQIEDFRKHLGTAAEHAAGEDWTQSASEAERAVAIYPGYVEPGSPYVMAVRARVQLEDTAAARAHAEEYFNAGGRDPEVLEFLAEQLEGASALDVYRARALTVPLTVGARQDFADALLAQGDAAAAAREYQVVLELEPHDLAAAHFQFASALAASGDAVAARQQVLLALEIAPRYSEALSLLMTLHTTDE
jgi:tetratricopeptide (TPR) repeat protein